jgi:hypothetical protein
MAIEDVKQLKTVPNQGKLAAIVLKRHAISSRAAIHPFVAL